MTMRNRTNGGVRNSNTQLLQGVSFVFILECAHVRKNRLKVQRDEPLNEAAHEDFTASEVVVQEVSS